MSKVNELLSEISKRKGNLDIVGANGEVFGHIINSSNKTFLFSLKMKIRKILPEVSFKILKKISNQGKISWELYGNYYKYSGDAIRHSFEITNKVLFNHKNRTNKGYVKI
jgi:hypothetical protein